jgi:hypothetical protein
MFNHYLGYQKEGYSDLSQDQKIAIVPQILGERSVLRAEHASAPILLCLSPPLDDKSSQQDDKSSQTVNNSYCADSIVNSVIGAFIGRSNVGLQKYGTTLDRDDLSILDWIQHAQEEHMDAILYLEKLKTKLREP